MKNNFNSHFISAHYSRAPARDAVILFIFHSWYFSKTKGKKKKLKCKSNLLGALSHYFYQSSFIIRDKLHAVYTMICEISALISLLFQTMVLTVPLITLLLLTLIHSSPLKILALCVCRYAIMWLSVKY